MIIKVNHRSYTLVERSVTALCRIYTILANYPLHLWYWQNQKRPILSSIGDRRVIFQTPKINMGGGGARNMLTAFTAFRISVSDLGTDGQDNVTTL